MDASRHPELGDSPVHLHDHDPSWIENFAREREAIHSAIGHIALAIEHVGSTSVPLVCAKPIIDIAVSIPSLDDAPACVEPLAGVGYEYVPDFEVDLPARRYFRKDAPDGTRTHHIHMYAYDHQEFIDMVAFRDHMRMSPDDARAYEALKRDLASRLGRRDYTRAKAPFIQGLLARIRETPQGRVEPRSS